MLHISGINSENCTSAAILGSFKYKLNIFLFSTAFNDPSTVLASFYFHFNTSSLYFLHCLMLLSLFVYCLIALVPYTLCKALWIEMCYTINLLVNVCHPHTNGTMASLQITNMLGTHTHTFTHQWNIHQQTAIWGSLSYPTTTSTCRPEELMIEPPTLWLVDDLLYLLNYSCHKHQQTLKFKI